MLPAAKAGTESLTRRLGRTGQCSLGGAWSETLAADGRSETIFSASGYSAIRLVRPLARGADGGVVVDEIEWPRWSRGVPRWFNRALADLMTGLWT
jgi:hypothetical protein